jgi:hypothetical protein
VAPKRVDASIKTEVERLKANITIEVQRTKLKFLDGYLVKPSSFL